LVVFSYFGKEGFPDWLPARQRNVTDVSTFYSPNARTLFTSPNIPFTALVPGEGGGLHYACGKSGQVLRPRKKCCFPRQAPRRGTPGQIPPPIDDIETFWSPAEKAMASHSLLCSAVGSPETIERGLRKFIEITEADELMLTGLVFDQKARLRSYEIAAEVRERIGVDESKEKVTAADRS